MHRRVRLLYLEFMYLLSQIESFYAPRPPLPRSSASAAANTAGAKKTPWSTQYLRIPTSHPLCPALRQLGAVEFASKHALEEAVVIFRAETPAQLEILQQYLPRNWANNSTSVSPASDDIGGAGQHRRAAADYRSRVQQMFYANALLSADSPEWKRCLGRGRYELRGLQTVIHVRKYRALNKRYGWASQLSAKELEVACNGNIAQVEQALLGLSNKDIYGYVEDYYDDDDDDNTEETKKIG